MQLCFGLFQVNQRTLMPKNLIIVLFLSDFLLSIQNIDVLLPLDKTLRGSYSEHELSLKTAKAHSAHACNDVGTFCYYQQIYQNIHITMMKRIRSKQPSQPPSFGFPLLSFLGLSPPPQLPPDEPLPPKKASNAMKSPKSSIYFCVTSHHP